MVNTAVQNKHNWSKIMEAAEILDTAEVKPHRVQRKRTRGWKMPENTVYVGRPSVWANPFLADRTRIHSPKVLQGVMDVYRLHIEHLIEQDPDFLEPLRGKNLACWCPLSNPKWDRVYCHADVLLEMANK
jgi:hypothetical protein